MRTAATRDAGVTSERPFFPEGAVIRRVHSEAIVLAGGGRALLMQVAHPLVARGVAEHSSFRNGKRQRLLRTLRPTLAIVFGTEAQAREAAASINAVHDRVVGASYRARDPQLLFWVLATLIDTALFMHERFLKPLKESDAEAYYEDMLCAGELLGVRRDLAPPDLAAFRSYMDRRVDSLHVSDEARAIAVDLFSGQGPSRAAGWVLREWTAALLPRELRQAYGFAGEARGGTAMAWLAKPALAVAPSFMRRTPAILLPSRWDEAGGARR
jgi:uncharacterized protein (DUF2236 family)